MRIERLYNRLKLSVRIENYTLTNNSGNGEDLYVPIKHIRDILFRLYKKKTDNHGENVVKISDYIKELENRGDIYQLNKFIEQTKNVQYAFVSESYDDRIGYEITYNCKATEQDYKVKRALDVITEILIKEEDDDN